jgi:DNA-binding MarR family transcriptional regulator
MTGKTNPAEVAELLFASFKRMHRLVDVELSEHGLSLSRAKILGALERSGPSNQSTLAVAFDLAPRTITELVDVLERDGLVERRTDPADRRARQVHLTAAGHEAHLRAQETRTRVMTSAFGTLTDQQLHDLGVTLRQIDKEVQIACGTPDCGPPIVRKST